MKEVRYYFLGLFFFVAFVFGTARAQVSLSGQFRITLVNSSPSLVTSDYQIGGNFVDLNNYIFNVDMITTGDYIVDATGKIYRIDLIIERNNPYIKADVKYITGAIIADDTSPAGDNQVGAIIPSYIKRLPNAYL